MKKAIAVIFKAGNPYCKKKIADGTPIYEITLKRILQLQEDVDHILLACSDDRDTRDFVETHIREKYPRLPVYFGDEANLSKRVFAALQQTDAEIAAIAAVTQPLFNKTLVLDMFTYFETRFTEIDYLFQQKLPSAFAFDFVKIQILQDLKDKCSNFSSYLKAGMEPGEYRSVEYLPYYLEQWERYPSDLFVNTWLDFEVNRRVLETVTVVEDVSMRQMGILFEQTAYDVTAPLKNLSIADRMKIQEKFQLPTALTLELMSYCNLNCEFCITNKLQIWKHRRSRMMDFALFKKIVDDVAAFTTQIDLLGGEPLLNKDIYKMCDYARSKNIRIQIFSNLQLLSKGDNLKKILDSPPDEIVIAYDAPDRETYETTRVRGDFENLSDGIRQLVKAKKERGAQYPVITLQMVLTKKNMHLRHQFWGNVKELGADNGRIKPLGLWPEGDKEYEKKMVEEYLVPRTFEPVSRHGFDDEGKLAGLRWPGLCPGARLPFIGSGGEIYPCYYIAVENPAMGNVMEKSFFGTWNSLKYRKYRNKMLNDWAHPLCEKCIGIPSGFEARKI